MGSPTKKFYHNCLSEQTSHLESQCSCTVLLMDVFLVAAASSESFPLFLWRHLALGDDYDVTVFLWSAECYALSPVALHNQEPTEKTLCFTTAYITYLGFLVR